MQRCLTGSRPLDLPSGLRAWLLVKCRGNTTFQSCDQGRLPLAFLKHFSMCGRSRRPAWTEQGLEKWQLRAVLTLLCWLCPSSAVGTWCPRWAAPACICCQLPYGSTTCSILADEVCAGLGREGRPPGQAWSFTVLLEALLSALLSLYPGSQPFLGALGFDI